ncbi:MAG: tyrosine-type recombinase/integrase [Cyclobacteriaceae bacterium]
MTESFIKYITYEKRFSKHTISSYENDLKQFYSFLANEHPDISLTEISHGIIRQWVVHLAESGILNRTVNRKITSIKSYFKFLLNRGFIEENPTTRIHILKTPKSLPDFIKLGEMDDLLSSDHFTDDFTGKRDMVIFELLYGTGIRLSELIHLKEADVDFTGNQIKVLGKRNKERIIPITLHLRSLLKTYVEQKNSHLGSNASQYLIVTILGKQSYPMMIYRIVNQYLTLHTHVDKKSPHILRHTYATHLLDKGAELAAVKDLLGHQSLAATQIYTHNSLGKLKKVFEQAHPKA